MAELYALGQLPTVTLADPATRQRRALIEHRQKLVGRRVAVQNRIRAIFVSQGLPAPRGAAAWSKSGLAGMAAQARPLAECALLELWRGRLEGGGQATPMTYVSRKTGRQYVVIAAGGHQFMHTDLGDALQAFALPVGASR